MPVQLVIKQLGCLIDVHHHWHKKRAQMSAGFAVDLAQIDILAMDEEESKDGSFAKEWNVARCERHAIFSMEEQRKRTSAIPCQSTLLAWRKIGKNVGFSPNAQMKQLLQLVAFLKVHRADEAFAAMFKHKAATPQELEKEMMKAFKHVHLSSVLHCLIITCFANQLEICANS